MATRRITSSNCACACADVSAWSIPACRASISTKAFLSTSCLPGTVAATWRSRSRRCSAAGMESEGATTEVGRLLGGELGEQACARAHGVDLPVERRGAAGLRLQLGNLGLNLLQVAAV